MTKKVKFLVIALLFIYTPALSGAGENEQVFKEMENAFMGISKERWRELKEEASKNFSETSIREIQTFEAKDKEQAFEYGFSKDMRNVITINWKLTRKIWDINSGKLLKSIPTKQKDLDMIDTLTLHSDLPYAIVGRYDGKLRYWNIETESGVINFKKKYSGTLHPVALSPDHNYTLSAGGKDDYLVLWDVKTGNDLKIIVSGFITTVAIFSSDSKFAVSGYGVGNISLWEIPSGKEIMKFKGHTSMISSLEFSPDGKYILSASWDSTIRLWDIKTGKEVKRFNDKRYKFDKKVPYETSAPFGDHPHYAEIEVAAFSPDGRYVLSGGRNEIVLWNIESEQAEKIFEGHQDRVTKLKFSPDGRYALSSAWDNTVKLWDIFPDKK